MRLLIISNRLPITIEEQDDDKLTIKQSVGGLVSGVRDYLELIKFSDSPKLEHLWIGSTVEAKEKEKKQLFELFAEHDCHPVFLAKKTMDNFYYGFCNKILWPLFHTFPSYVEYNEKYWKNYKEVNLIFAQQILNIMKDEDIVWVHDYHLMLLPRILKIKKPNAKIIFFLHIPFPNFEVFRLLPKTWLKELLEGLLGADVIGFHTYEYSQNFLQVILRFLGFTNEFGKLLTNERLIKVGTFPIGINFNKFNSAIDNPIISNNIKHLKRKFKEFYVILSIDRLDYTKGILNRLQGYELFLRSNPQYSKRVIMIMIVVPGRVGVEHYQRTKKEIDEMVGKINGEFGNVEWAPILYQTKFLPYENLVALYNIADVMLVSPLRDGMNLVIKEYIASKKDSTGVSILSEMAGAAQELTEAILVNPNDIAEIASSIKEALEMPIEEQIRRNRIMQNRLRRYDIVKWGNEQIKELILIKEEQNKLSVKFMNSNSIEKLHKEYNLSKKRIIFLDYDGTLVPFASSPIKAKPDIELLDLLKKLTDDKRNKIVIISGRDKQILDEWFSSLNVSIIAEHGIWIKEGRGTDWQLIKSLNNEWKFEILNILSTFSDWLPGSFVEEKDFSVVLHYRQSNPEQSQFIVKNAVEYLTSLTANLDLQIWIGSKVIEVKCGGINKGIAVLNFLNKDNYDFILALGDDITDEETFKALPENAYSIKIGITHLTNAKFNLSNYIEARELLKRLTKKYD